MWIITAAGVIIDVVLVTITMNRGRTFKGFMILSRLYSVGTEVRGSETNDRVGGFIEVANTQHVCDRVTTINDFYRTTACNAVHCIAIAILSVCPSIRLSDACIVTKLNDALRIF